MRRSCPQRPARCHLLLLVPILLVACVAAHAQTTSQNEEVLTNESVIKMVRASLSTGIIISKIRTSKTNFSLSTDELIRLKHARVPEEIITAMVNTASNEAAKVSITGAGDATRTDPNDPLSTHDGGIYLYQEKDGKRTMVQLEPTIPKQSKAGGFLKQAITYGIAKVKVKAVLAGANARMQIDNPRPVFYFYFEAKNSGLSSSNYLATSPNEFALVKFETKKSGREVTVSQANIFGAEGGTLDKYVRAFDYEKLAPGVYKVTPRENLQDGEYGFYLGNIGGASGAKIFDFGINLPR